MTNYKCIDCDQPVRERQEGLLCDGCNRWNHCTCNTGVSRSQYGDTNRNDLDIDWQCRECRDTQPPSPLAPQSPPSPSVPQATSSPVPSPTSTVRLYSGDESSLEDLSVGDIEPQLPAPVTCEEQGTIHKKVMKTK